MIRSKLPHTQLSIFSKMSGMAAEYGAINLSQGFPNFKSDPLLIEGVNKAMVDGYNQYAPMAGDPELRQAISDKIEMLYSHTYNPDTEITITAGATQAIFTAIASVINKGDEVIIFEPAYDCYSPTIRLFGGVVVPISLQPPEFSPNWDMVESKISDRTRLIIINSPHNPSGKLFSEGDMLRLQKICERHPILVLSDEVYEHIIFDGHQHESVARYPALASRSFVMASFGKTFHNTGWKMGYCAAPRDLSAEFRKVHQFNVFCANHPIQKALATYLQDSSRYQQLGDFYQEKRDIFNKALDGSGFKLVPSKGTYFQLLDYSELSDMGDVEFAEFLTKEHKVAVIPISVFYEDGMDNRLIRVCFAKTEDTLQQAANHLNNL